MKKLSYEEVKQAFIDRGYILISQNYVNNHSKIKYCCPRHLDEMLSIEFADFKRGHGCKYCGIESSAEKRRNKNK